MSIVDQNVKAVKGTWDVIRNRVRVLNKRALNRAGRSALSAGQKHVSETYAIKAKFVRDKRLIRARTLNDSFNISIRDDRLNVRDFAVREKWVTVAKDKSVSNVNKSRRKQSRRRMRVKIWQYSISNNKWVTLPKAFAMAKAGNRLLQRAGKERLPIRGLYAPSLGHLMTSSGAKQVIRDKFYERYEIEYKRIADQ